MKLIMLSCAVLLTGCASMMPDVAKITDDLTDTGIRVDIAKEALEMKDTDMKITVDLISKDPVVSK